MAHQADYYNHLAKVGREGFALLEELDLIRRPKKFGNSHQPPQEHDSRHHPQHYNNYQYEHHQPAYHKNYQYEHHQPSSYKNYQNEHHQPAYYKNYQYEHHQPAYYNNHQYEHHPPAAYIYRGPQIITVMKEPVIDSNQAAQFYGGKVVVDHSIRKPIPNGGY